MICSTLIVMYFIIIPYMIQVESEDLAPNVTTISDNSTSEVDNVTSNVNNNTDHKGNESENITTETEFPDETTLENATGIESNTSKSIDTTEISKLQDENSTDSVDTNAISHESIDHEENQSINSTTVSNPSNLDNNRCSNSNDSNDYIDNLIEKISKNYSGEMKLPSKYGFFTLTNGRIWGLSDMQRVGDAEITCNNSSVTLRALLRFEDVKAEYTWKRKTILNTWKGRVILLVDKIDIMFGIKQKNSEAYLDYFKIKGMSGIKTEVTGLTYITWALSRLTNLVINNFRRTVSIIIAGPFKEAFAEEIRSMKFPQV